MDGSELDYLTSLWRKALLAPHRETLLHELDAWQAGKLPMHVPLKRIEELIDEEIFEPDVLMVHGDYEHYRYSD